MSYSKVLFYADFGPFLVKTFWLQNFQIVYYILLWQFENVNYYFGAYQDGIGVMVSAEKYIKVPNIFVLLKMFSRSVRLSR